MSLCANGGRIRNRQLPTSWDQLVCNSLAVLTIPPIRSVTTAYPYGMRIHLKPSTKNLYPKNHPETQLLRPEPLPPAHPVQARLLAKPVKHKAVSTNTSSSGCQWSGRVANVFWGDPWCIIKYWQRQKRSFQTCRLYLGHGFFRSSELTWAAQGLNMSWTNFENHNRLTFKASLTSIINHPSLTIWGDHFTRQYLGFSTETNRIYALALGHGQKPTYVAQPDLKLPSSRIVTSTHSYAIPCVNMCYLLSPTVNLENVDNH